MSQDTRPIRPAIIKGLTRKCPNCGEGNLFSGYLKVIDNCPSCGEDYTHQRADDGPAWATILITGHLVPPLIMGIYEGFENPAPWKVGLFVGWIVIVVTLLLLPRIKGAFVALQWANRMHGFGAAPQKATVTAIPRQ